MNKNISTRRGIFVVLIALVVSYSISINFSKISASTSLIMDEFCIGAHEIGQLVSLVGIVGLVVSLPVGYACCKYGPRICGILTLIFSIVGSIIGSVAPTFEILMFSRFLEGIGIGTIVTIVPSVIVDWIKPKLRPVFLVLFAGYIAVGQSVIFFFANFMIDPDVPGTFRNLWHFSTIALIFCMILWVLFVVSPDDSTRSIKKFIYLRDIDFKLAFKNSIAWLMCVVMFCFSAGGGALSTFTMHYCEINDVDVLIANNFSFIRSIVMVVVSLICGIVLIYMNFKRTSKFFVFSAFLMCLSFAIMFRYVGTTQAVITMVLAGIANALLPGIGISMSPDISAKNEYTGVTNGFISAGRNIGIISVSLSGAIIDFAGFDALAWVDTGIGIVAIVLSFVMYSLIKKRILSKDVEVS